MDIIVFADTGRGYHQAKIPGSLLIQAQKEPVSIPTEAGDTVDLHSAVWLNYAEDDPDRHVFGAIQGEAFSPGDVYYVLYSPAAKPPYLCAFKV